MDDFGIGTAITFFIVMAISGWGVSAILGILILTGVL